MTVIAFVAFHITITSHRYAHTFHLRIAGETSWTGALFVVCLYVAFSIHAASLCLQAGIHALTTLTYFRSATFGVEYAGRFTNTIRTVGIGRAVAGHLTWYG